jgi:hypothetical protein
MPNNTGNFLTAPCIQASRNNNGNLGYVTNAVSTRQTLSSTTDTINFIKAEQKEHLHTLEKDHIYKIRKKQNRHE